MVPAVITPLPPLPAMATETELLVAAPPARASFIPWGCKLGSLVARWQVNWVTGRSILMQIKVCSSVIAENCQNTYSGTRMQQ
jgi:hypothetical protein